MSVIPFINAPLLIQVHAMFAIVALCVGPVAIHRRRRDRIHKVAGYVWVVAMFSVATTALFIPAHDLRIIGQLGPIHVFVALTYWGLWSGMAAIFRRDIVVHQLALRNLYYQGLAIAGLFNFLPGRMVNRMILPEAPQAGLVIIAVGGAALLYVAVRQRQNLRRARGQSAQAVT